MRGFVFLISFLALTSTVSDGWVEAFITAKLADQKVIPSCLMVKPVRMVQLWFGGVGSKPAIKVENNCETDLTFTRVNVKAPDSLDLQLLSHVVVLVTSVKHGTTDYKTFLFSNEEGGCSNSQAEDFLLKEQKKSWEASYAKWEKESLQGHPKPHLTLEDYLDKYIPPVKQGRLKDKEIICTQLLSLSSGAAATLSVEYNHRYALQGYVGRREENSPVRIEGAVIEMFAK